MVVLVLPLVCLLFIVAWKQKKKKKISLRKVTTKCNNNDYPPWYQSPTDNKEWVGTVTNWQMHDHLQLAAATQTDLPVPCLKCDWNTVRCSEFSSKICLSPLSCNSYRITYVTCFDQQNNAQVTVMPEFLRLQLKSCMFLRTDSFTFTISLRTHHTQPDAYERQGYTEKTDCPS